jgi:hypothetical protein
MKYPSQLLKYASHIVFWVTTCLFFIQYSFLRPGYCSDGRYKEILCVLIIAIVVYLNKFLLFPKIYLKGRHLLFWCINTLLILTLGFSELQIIESNIFKIHGNNISAEEYSRYLIDVFVVISLRDAAFLAFFYIVRVNLKMKLLLLLRQKLLAVENKQVIITYAEKEILVNIADIVYISSKRNITTVHLTNGKEYNQYNSLAYMEEILPKHLYVRINRSNIIMCRHVCKFDENNVTMRINDNSEQKSIPIQRAKKNEKYQLLKKYVIETIKIDGEIKNVIKDKKWRNGKDDFGEMNEDAKQVLETIRKNPSIFASEIKRNLSYFSERNIDRHLRLLKNLGLIEFRGSRRTGGYYPK